MSKVAEHPEAPVDPSSGAAVKPKLLDEIRACSEWSEANARYS
jgi:hypothetical protein